MWCRGALSGGDHGVSRAVLLARVTVAGSPVCGASSPRSNRYQCRPRAVEGAKWGADLGPGAEVLLQPGGSITPRARLPIACISAPVRVCADIP